VYQAAYAFDDVLRLPAEPYTPQEGDILFFCDGSLKWRILFALAGTTPPDHAAIVVKKADGSPAILESGPNDTLVIALSDLMPRLQSYEGQIWVRRRRTPLTAEQSARLTAFAMPQEGKPYALIRLGGQLTFLRHRGPLRTIWMGKPQGNRSSYWCSELVLEACVAGGLLDAETTRPSATYPRDIFYDRTNNWYINKHLHKVAEGWHPPARWTNNPFLPSGTK
jgi:hypothetical protein